MLELFKRREVVEKEEMNGLVENVMSAEDIQKALIMMSVRFIETYIPKIEKEESLAIRRLKMLKEVGLDEIYNATQLTKITADDQHSQSVRKMIEEVRSIYSSALIVSWDDFYKIIKKYNLAIDLIQNYKKPIPEKNLDELIRASYKFNEHSRNFQSNIYMINEMEIKKDGMSKKELNDMIDYWGRIPIIRSYNFFEEPTEQINTVKRFVNNFTIYNSYSPIKKAWFIAAPISDLPNNVKIRITTQAEIDERKRVEDPIIFKATEFGVIIATMWDKEANDEIFEKYKKGIN